MFPRSIDIGPFSIHLYGLIIAFAIYAGWYLAKKRAKIYKQSLRSSSSQNSTAGLRIPQKFFDDPILLVPLVLSVIGARIYHVLDLWSYYGRNLTKIVEIQNGGLGIWGGILGMLLGLLIVVKVKKLDFLKSLDLAAPSIILGQTIGRFGNFINQEGFGPPTNLPWGVPIDPANRPAQYLLHPRFHPTFFYEAFLNLVFFILLLYLAGKVKSKGQVFALYLIFYAAARTISEFWRIDTWVVDGVKISYIFSLAAFICGVGLFYRQSQSKA